MFGIDQQVQQTADAYRGKPQMLQQKYAQNQQLIDLLALQKLKSDKEEASRQMALQMGGQGKPPTIADQRESQVLDMTKKEVVDQQAGVMQNRMQQQQAAQQKLLQSAGAPQMPAQAMPQQQQPPAQGLAGLPAPNIQGMAGGGIVAFDEGGQAGEEEARRAMEQRRQQPAPQQTRESAPQGNMQAGLARLLGIDPEAIYQRRNEEAARASNYTPEERAVKQRQIDERSASYDRNKLARALMGMAGYSSPALAIAGGGAAAANDADQAMRERQRGEGQLVDMGPASRMAGLKAGETAYGHAMPGLVSGVKAGVDLAQVGEQGAARAQNAAILAAAKAEAAATTDERNRLSIAEAGFNKNKQLIFKQMADLRIEPGSPESIPYYNRVNEMGKTIYDKLQISKFFVPEPAPIMPVAPPEKPSMLSGVKGFLGLNPTSSGRVVDFRNFNPTPRSTAQP
jgi:hypothetical protein